MAVSEIKANASAFSEALVNLAEETASASRERDGDLVKSAAITLPSEFSTSHEYGLEGPGEIWCNVSWQSSAWHVLFIAKQQRFASEEECESLSPGVEVFFEGPAFDLVLPANAFTRSGSVDLSLQEGIGAYVENGFGLTSG